MPAKRTVAPPDALRLMLRQASGRYVSKFSLNGREKRRTRALPSLPALSCLAVTADPADPQMRSGNRQERSQTTLTSDGERR